jgi:hypothetical protein
MIQPMTNAPAAPSLDLQLAAAGQPTTIPAVNLIVQLEALVRNLARSCQIDDAGAHEAADTIADMAIADFVNAVPQWAQARLARVFERRIQCTLDADRRQSRKGRRVTHGQEQIQIWLSAIVEGRRLRGGLLKPAVRTVARTVSARGLPVTPRRIVRWRQYCGSAPTVRARYLRLAAALQAHPEREPVVIDRLLRHHLMAIVTMESV